MGVDAPISPLLFFRGPKAGGGGGSGNPECPDVQRTPQPPRSSLGPPKRQTAGATRGDLLPFDAYVTFLAFPPSGFSAFLPFCLPKTSLPLHLRADTDHARLHDRVGVAV